MRGNAIADTIHGQVLAELAAGGYSLRFDLMRQSRW